MEKYKDDPLLEGIQFHSVSHLSDVIEKVLVDE